MTQHDLMDEDLLILRYMNGHDRYWAASKLAPLITKTALVLTKATTAERPAATMARFMITRDEHSFLGSMQRLQTVIYA